MLNEVTKNKIVEETLQYKYMNLHNHHDIYSNETVLMALIRKDLELQIENLDTLIQLERELIEEEKLNIEKLEKTKMEYLKRVEVIENESSGIDNNVQRETLSEDDILDFLIKNLNLEGQNIQGLNQLKDIIKVCPYLNISIFFDNNSLIKGFIG